MTKAGLLAAAAALLTACGGTASVPPCNALIWLFGSADLTFDCPAVKAIPLLQGRQQKDNPQ